MAGTIRLSKIMMFLIFIVTVGIALFFLPWKALIEDQIKNNLETQGFQHFSLHIGQIDLNEIIIQDITLGDTSPLTLQNLILSYSIFDVLAGKPIKLHIKGLNIGVNESDQGWNISGLTTQKNNTVSKTPQIPVTLNELNHFPIDNLTLDDGHLIISGKDWRSELPFNFEWIRGLDTKLHLQGNGISLSQAGTSVMSGKIDTIITLQEKDKAWIGTWEIKDILIKSGDTILPLLQAKGLIKAEATGIMVTGDLKSADTKTQLHFGLNYYLAEPLLSFLSIKHGQVPWDDGLIVLDNTHIPLVKKEDIVMSVRVDNVPLDPLLQTLTGQKASATGSVSGVIPITIKANGKMVFGHGGLNANSKGRISLKPELIPGDQEQIILVRTIMENLLYSTLSMTTLTDINNKLSVTLAVEGRNPEWMEGRAVKLNIQLNGDILDLVQNNMMLLLDPKFILKQGLNKQSPPIRQNNKSIPSTMP